ncbi:MAG: FHA domain-containing protein [Pseudomonadota bacterium]
MTEAGTKGLGATLRCQRCGRDNPIALRFCQDCGQRLGPPAGSSAPLEPARSVPAAIPRPEPKPETAAPKASTRCAECGAESPATARFCVACGRPLSAAPPLTAEAVPRSAGATPPPPAAGAVTAFAGARSESSEVPLGRSAPVARLVVIAQDGTPGREYPLTSDPTDIGREEGAILLPGDPYVSPRHARISLRDGRVFLRDLGSVNGVYVRIRAAERLEHADLVLMGLEVLRFEVVTDAEKGLGPAIENGTRVFGSPALPRYARLLQRTVEGVTRDVFYLSRDESVVGRESGDIVFTHDPFMSRRHAVFARDPSNNTFWLHDLGSSNGTYLAVRGERELFQGDHLRVGQHLFRLDFETGGPRS